MRRIIRICAVATVLCTVLLVGSISTSHHKALACGPYAIPGSFTTYQNQAAGVWVQFELDYDSCTGENYSDAYVVAGSPWLKVGVRRYSGPDGGGIDQVTNCGVVSGHTCYSPRVYSPNNKASAYVILANINNETIWSDGF